MYCTDFYLLQPTPIPSPRISIGATPSVSLIVSVTTPHGSGETEQSSLRTIQTESTPTERDIGRDLADLADEIRGYDQQRGTENNNILDNVQSLRNELRELVQFLDRTPPAAPAPVVVAQPPSVAAIRLTDQRIGGSTVLSSLYPSAPRAMDLDVVPD